MKQQFLLLSCLVLLSFSFLTSNAQKKITWVTDEVTNDAAYVAFLTNAGYTVTASAAYSSLTAAKKLELNAADLVIISKRTNSANYADAALWASVTKPLINLNNYINRSSRMQFLNTTVNNDALDKFMIAKAKTHPIFTNTILSARDSTLELSTEVFQGNDLTTAGSGTVIAAAPVNNVITIATWEAGTPFYTGSATPAAKRMWYSMSYSFNLTAAGQRLFLDAIEYMITGAVTSKTTSISKQKLNNSKLTLFPNPTSNILVVDGATELHADILSLTGQVIKSVNQSNNRINVSDLPKGIYLLLVKVDGNTVVEKFTKQ